MTGLQHINNALGILAVLHPGSSATASQITKYMIVLNEILTSYTARGFAGTSFASNVATQTVVTAYANETVDNSYPVGWDRMIDFALAFNICGFEGRTGQLDWLTSMVEASEKGAMHS